MRSRNTTVNNGSVEKMCLRADPARELNTTVLGFNHLERQLLNLSAIVFEPFDSLPLLDSRFPYLLSIAMQVAPDVIAQKATNSTIIINFPSASRGRTSYMFRYLCR